MAIVAIIVRWLSYLLLYIAFLNLLTDLAVTWYLHGWSEVQRQMSPFNLPAFFGRVVWLIPGAALYAVSVKLSGPSRVAHHGVTITAVAALVTAVPLAYVVIQGADQAAARTAAERSAFKRQALEGLDQWVAAVREEDEAAADIQGGVIDNCGKLVMFSATSPEDLEFMLADDRAEFDMRVDACAKLTAHRVSPQPEFEHTELVEFLCSADSHPTFRELCERANLTIR